MTVQRKLKKAIRERMQRTGESYTEARRMMQSGQEAPEPPTELTRESKPLGCGSASGLSTYGGCGDLMTLDELTELVASCGFHVASIEEGIMDSGYAFVYVRDASPAPQQGRLARLTEAVEKKRPIGVKYYIRLVQ